MTTINKQLIRLIFTHIHRHRCPVHTVGFVPDFGVPDEDIICMSMYCHMTPKNINMLSDENRTRSCNILWETETLGYHVPVPLLHTVWYLNSKCLVFRASQESRQLRWGDIKLKVSHDNGEYFEYNQRLTK